MSGRKRAGRSLLVSFSFYLSYVHSRIPLLRMHTFVTWRTGANVSLLPPPSFSLYLFLPIFLSSLPTPTPFSFLLPFPFFLPSTLLPNFKRYPFIADPFLHAFNSTVVESFGLEIRTSEKTCRNSDERTFFLTFSYSSTIRQSDKRSIPNS